MIVGRVRGIVVARRRSARREVDLEDSCPGQRVADPTARCVRVGAAKLGVLICGELFNRELADSLAAEQPDLVVDLGHLSMTRFTKSLTRVATTIGCPVVHTQHVSLNASNVSKWQATPRWPAWRENDFAWASYNEPSWRPNALWAEVKIWQI
jgi:predicted amidohydrolase